MQVYGDEFQTRQSVCIIVDVCISGVSIKQGSTEDSTQYTCISRGALGREGRRVGIPPLRYTGISTPYPLSNTSQQYKMILSKIQHKISRFTLRCLALLFA